MKTPACVATIAGTDPSGGAGIQADIKAISATGCYAASIITALLAQNTQGVQAIQEVPPDMITKQIDSVFSDLTIRGVKIGMLHNKAVIDVVVEALKKYQPPFIVLDPVMVAKNGCPLLDLNVVNYLKNRLFPLVTLITPNLFEAEKIVERKIENTEAMASAAMEIGHQFNIHVLIKGGHLSTSHSSDVLYIPSEQKNNWFHAERIHSKNTHGTGCTLSAALASYLAQDYPLPAAVQAAKDYLTQALAMGSTQNLGKGHGPVDHFYFLREGE
ncbi:MAG: phosphomethylpyrimidine kinase [Gammaproteobacteria bacterium]|jgi:hydroxymethylpyrimidine/phosphomethylpyrimidine kinase|nr:phosphomethylpyrimidine kinase [Gammaproteobacteria bacterium]